MDLLIYRDTVTGQTIVLYDQNIDSAIWQMIIIGAGKGLMRDEIVKQFIEDGRLVLLETRNIDPTIISAEAIEDLLTESSDEFLFEEQEGEES